MRVVHVVPTQFGGEGLFGGGERYPLELARALARDVDCELVTFGRRPRRWREPSGLRVRVLRRVANLRGHPAHPLAWGLPRAVAGADVVHTHHLRSAPSRTAALTALVAGGHRVTTDHGLGGGGWGGLLPRLFERFLVVSRHSARVLGAPIERTRVLYGGVDPGRFTPDPDARRHGVLFLGRITPHKGLDRLLAALPDGARLTVAGSVGHDRSPPERDYPDLLRRLAAGKDVRLTGPVDDADVPRLLRTAAVVVVPTVERTCYGVPVPVTELLGLTALEAMAAGTPVVASRTGALPEVVRDGETGFLVPPGDLDALRDRIGTVLGDPALAGRLGRAARARALEQFTWDAAARRCHDAYAELVG